MTLIPDQHIILFEFDGTSWFVSADDRNRIDAAVTAYLDNGRDSLVHATMIDGSELTLLASQVTGWRYQSVANLKLAKQQGQELEALMGGKQPWENS